MSPRAFSLRILQAQPDARLIALAREGHEAAFEVLVRRYRRQLLAYCRRIGGPHAEDAVQQTFLQAWVALSEGVEVRGARAWLYRIAHNVAISDARRRANAPVLLDVTGSAHGAEDEAEQRRRARDALAGLAALPALQRKAMVGTALDGLSHDEIARELGLSGGAVRGLIYRARAALRRAAAALIPGPLISWAARSGPRPGSAAFYEATAGGGSAGLAGLLVKGGAIAATAGALVGAAGLATHHRGRPHPRGRTAVDVAGRAASDQGGPRGGAELVLAAALMPTATTSAAPGGLVGPGRHGAVAIDVAGLAGVRTRRTTSPSAPGEQAAGCAASPADGRGPCGRGGSDPHRTGGEITYTSGGAGSGGHPGDASGGGGGEPVAMGGGQAPQGSDGGAHADGQEHGSSGTAEPAADPAQPGGPSGGPAGGDSAATGVTDAGHPTTVAARAAPPVGGEATSSGGAQNLQP